MKKHENQGGVAEWEMVYTFSRNIPTTITQLRKAMPGWDIYYTTVKVRVVSHRIFAVQRVTWHGPYNAISSIEIRITDKAEAVVAAYAAMQAMEGRDAKRD